MTLRRIVPPTEPVVTIEEARAQLRVDAYGSPPSHPEDELIMDIVQAVTEDLDAGTGWLGRALAPQTWQMSLNYIGGTKCIKLPYPPFIEIVSFTYTNTDGDVVVMAEGLDYRVVQGDPHAELKPVYNGQWPQDVRDDDDSVVITFRCGYVTGSPETVAVPELIKRYVKAFLTEAYDNRDVEQNALTLNGAMPQRIPNTLNSIRVRDNDQ